MTSKIEAMPVDNTQPIFVIGNPRSGTTLVRLVITTHSAVCIPPECSFIVRLFPKYGHLQHFTAAQARAFLSDLGGGTLDLAEQWEIALTKMVTSPEQLTDLSYPEACAHLYCAYAQAKGFGSARIWGDKNNSHSNYIDVLAGLYSKARFVHVVRDGRAVLNSYKQLNVDPAQKYAPLLPKNTAAVAARWTDMVDRADRHLTRFAAGRHMTVRYEDILSDFEKTVSELCGFLGLDYEPAMARFHEANIRHKLEPERYNWKANARQPLNVTRASAWRETLSLEDVRLFEAKSMRILRRHGYPVGLEASRAAIPDPYHMKGRIREWLRSKRKTAINLRRKVGM